MAAATLIEWCHATWNVITGCSIVSSGCKHCYAMRLAATRLRHHPSRRGLTDAHGRWTGEVRFNRQWLDQPLRWRKPRRIFVCAHSDLFHEKVPDEWVDLVLAVMALCPQHVFQVLTKRPERMRDYIVRFDGDEAVERVCDAAGGIMGQRGWDRVADAELIALPNAWLGVSVEDQRTANERIPLLLETPARVRWISAEPLLGRINLRNLKTPGGWSAIDALGGVRVVAGRERIEYGRSRLGWVVAGGESGLRARPMDPAWARSLRDQCAAAGVPFFFKQWGGRTPKAGGRLLDGRTWDEFPEVPA